ncbi:MAG: hypothetical protein N2512_13820 [Armatimonadetes bacterium]|nr:hypothetical protein [Armatimonadota bacterium]
MVSRRAIRAYLLATGLAAGLAQVVLFRELLVVATGTELVIGLVLAVWLAGAAAGSWWADRGAPNPIALARRGWRLAWLGAPALGFGVLALRAARLAFFFVPNTIANFFPPESKPAYLFSRLVAIQLGETLGLGHILFLSLVAILPAAMVCGAQFVTGARLLGRRWAGVAYALDALGHLAGGVALALTVTAFLDALLVAAACAPLYAVVAYALLSQPRQWALPRAAFGAGALTIALVVLSPASRTWRWPQQTVLEERTSVYGLVTVARQAGGGAYFFENGIPSGESPPTPRMEVLVNFALAQVSKLKKVLLVGGGVSGGLSEVLKHDPEQVDYLEFDPVFLALGRRWAVEADRKALADPRVRAIAMDPRLFLGQGNWGYDAIILAMPAPTTALINRFFTREWFAQCRQALAQGGVVAYSLPYSQVYRSDALEMLDATVVAATRSGIPQKELVFLAGEELVVAAAEGTALATSPERVIARLAQRGVDAPYLQAYIWDWMDPQNLAPAQHLLAGPRAAENSDLRPIGALLGTVYWLAQVTPTAAALVMPLLRLPGPGATALALLLAAPAVIGLAIMVIRRRASPGALPLMLAVGMTGMAHETALLMLLQTRHGYVYGLVGVLVGAFMLGVALAAWYVEARGIRVAGGLALGGTTMVVCGALIVAVAASNIPVGWLGFTLLALASGVAVGAVFPSVVDAARHAGRGRVGAVYAADLLGGVLAALTVPALIVPIAGIVPTIGASTAATAVFAAVMALALRTRT